MVSPKHGASFIVAISHGYNILKFVDVFNWFNNYFLVLVGFSSIVLTTINNMGMDTYSYIFARAQYPFRMDILNMMWSTEYTFSIIREFFMGKPLKQ